jgi:Domain of unknown function (DUF4145)
MAALVCPHCGVWAHFSLRWIENIDHPQGFFPPLNGCHTCDNCGSPIAAIHNGATRDILEYWPTKIAGKSFPDVPEQLAATASEAHVCLNAGSGRGAVALARAVVESIAKHKGITKGRLVEKIDDLHAAGHISEAMKEAAHEVRFAGNEVAHGDIVAEPLTIDDASEIVSLMDAILERVYQEPARVAQIRAKREGRTQKPNVDEAAAEFSDEPPF